MHVWICIINILPFFDMCMEVYFPFDSCQLYCRIKKFNMLFLQELYQELHTLDKMELEYQRKRLEEFRFNAAQRGMPLLIACSDSIWLQFCSIALWFSERALALFLTYMHCSKLFPQHLNQCPLLITQSDWWIIVTISWFANW